MEWSVEDRGAIEVWTIDGEGRRNSLTVAMLSELLGHLQRIQARRELRCVVVTGKGDRAFCAGADLKERARMTDDDVRAFHASLRSSLRGMEQAAQVFVAAINGAALGGGLELALACDIRIASQTAQLGLPEVSLGIIPGGGGTQRLSRAIGLARAKELVLTGRRIGAAEALACGLVSYTAPPQRLMEQALEVAERVAENAPVSLRQAKKAIDQGWTLPLDEALDLEHRMYKDCLGTKDRIEALTAFVEKRKPRFTGE